MTDLTYDDFAYAANAAYLSADSRMGLEFKFDTPTNMIGTGWTLFQNSSGTEYSTTNAFQSLADQGYSLPGIADFNARIFVDADTHQAIIAFKGTTTGKDWAADFETFGFNQPNPYIYATILYAQAAIQALTNAGITDITFTGHSLGAGLADIAAAYTGLHAVTFDPPLTSTMAIITATQGLPAMNQTNVFMSIPEFPAIPPSQTANITGSNILNFYMPGEALNMNSAFEGGTSGNNYLGTTIPIPDGSGNGVQIPSEVKNNLIAQVFNHFIDLPQLILANPALGSVISALPSLDPILLTTGLHSTPADPNNAPSFLEQLNKDFHTGGQILINLISDLQDITQISQAATGLDAAGFRTYQAQLETDAVYFARNQIDAVLNGQQPASGGLFDVQNDGTVIFDPSKLALDGLGQPESGIYFSGLSPFAIGADVSQIITFTPEELAVTTTDLFEVGQISVPAPSGQNIDGTTGINLVDYSATSENLSVAQFGPYLIVADSQNEDFLYQVQQVVLGSGNDSLALVSPSGYTIDAGSGFNTATFSSDLSAVAVFQFGSDLMVTDGGFQADKLVNVQDLTLTAQNDTVTLFSPSGHTIDGAGGTNTLNLDADSASFNLSPGASHVVLTDASNLIDRFYNFQKLNVLGHGDSLNLSGTLGLTIDLAHANTINYGSDLHSLTVSALGSGLLVSDGSDRKDMLINVSHIIGTSQIDTYNLLAPAGLTIDANGGSDVVNYTNSGIYDESNHAFWNTSGTTHDTLNGISETNIHAPIVKVLPAASANETLASGPSAPVFDYSGSGTSAQIVFNTQFSLVDHNNYFFASNQSLFGDPYYDASVFSGVSVTIGGVTDSGGGGGSATGINQGSGAANEIAAINGALFQAAGHLGSTIVGTNNGDTVTISDQSFFPDYLSYAPTAFFSSGTGNDIITIDPSLNTYAYAPQIGTVEYRGGDDVIRNAGHLLSLEFWEGISLDKLHVTNGGGSYADGGHDVVITADGFGSVTLQDVSASHHPNITLLSGGSVVFDTNGNASTFGTSQIAPVVNLTWGNDTWTGAAGATQTVYAYGGTNVITAGTNGHDTIYGGGTGPNTIISDSGVNTVYGGDGLNVFEVGKNAMTTVASSNGQNTVFFTDSNLSDYTVVQSGNALVFQNAAHQNVVTINDPNAISDIRFANGQEYSAADLYSGAPTQTNTLLHGDTYVIKSTDTNAISETQGLNNILVSNLSHNNFTYTINGNEMDLFANGSATPFATVNGINTFSTISFSDGYVALVDSLVAGSPQYLSISNGLLYAVNVQEPLSIHLPDLNTYTNFYGSKFGNLVWSDNPYGDIVVGGVGNDSFISNPDPHHGTAFYAEAGNNFYQIGAGDSGWISYGDAPTGIVANLETGIVSNGFGGTDILVNVHQIHDTSYNDNITGSTGNDILTEFGGSNVLNGNGGNDVVDYSYITQSLTVNLVSGIATHGTGTDTLIGIENVWGATSGNNNITGDAKANSIEIFNGNNVVNSGGGNDIITVNAFSGTGTNTINTGAGDDTINIFTANSTNTIIVHPGDGNDTINDLSGKSTINIQGVDPANLVYTRSGNDLIINYDESITIKNFYSTPTETYKLSFDNGQTLSLASLVTGAPLNHLPVAHNESFSDSPNHILIGNVLADNGTGADSDPDGDSLSVISQTVQSLNGGILVFSSSGDFTYTPPVGFTGLDRFFYEIDDGHGGTAFGSDTVLVQASPPTARADDFTTLQGQVITGNLLADNGHGADSDPNGLALTVLAGTDTAAQGTLTINSDGSFVYTPAAAYSGNFSFNYVLTNSAGGTTTGHANVTVISTNHFPVAQEDDFTGNRNQPITGNVLTDNGHGVDSDPDGDPLSVTAATINTATGGVVDLHADGTFTYTPANNYFGADTFNYTLLDGKGGFATGTVDLTIINTNQPPVAQPDSFNGNFNHDLTGNVLLDNGHGTDGDPDGNSLSITALTEATTAGGSVTLNADGTFDYHPLLGYVGSDSFTYTLLDGQGGTDTGTVTISIAAPAGAIVGTDGNDTINGGNASQTIIGLGGNDIISGGNGADTIYATSGNNVLHGNNGNDTLYAGSGIDQLYGDNGDDILVVATGNAAMTGGRGDDTFRFTDIRGYGVVTDFNDKGDDKLDLSLLIEGQSPTQQTINNFVHATQQGNNTIISVDADGAANGANFVAVATLQGVHNFDVSQALHNGSLIA